MGASAAWTETGVIRVYSPHRRVVREGADLADIGRQEEQRRQPDAKELCDEEFRSPA